MFQEYWDQARTFYYAQDMDTRAAITIFGTAALFVLAGFLLRCLLSFGAWVLRPLRSANATADVWDAMAELRTRIDNIVVPEPPEPPEPNDEDLPLADDVDEETDLYLAIKTLGKANARLADLADTALKTLRRVTDKLCDTTTNAVQAMSEAHSTVAQQICEEGRTALVQAVAAASPFIVKPESKLDDEDEE